MTSLARMGTLSLLLVSGCSGSHARGEGDAEVRPTRDASVVEDASVRTGTCPASVPTPVTSGVGPRRGVSGEGPWRGSVAGVDGAGLDLVLAGEEVRFAWRGSTLDGITAGEDAEVRREGEWLVLETARVQLWAFQYHAFTGSDLVGSPLAFEGGPAMRLVSDCTRSDGSSGGCGQPASLITLYALELEGDPLRADESRRNDDLTVWFGGAAQYPGYSSESEPGMFCVVEADFQAAITVRVDRGRPDRCDEIFDDYTAMVEDHRGCESDTDCQAVFGHCGVGLGGCYYALNVDLSSTLDTLAGEFDALGCTTAVCDCAPPPESLFCDAGQCAFAP